LSSRKPSAEAARQRELPLRQKRLSAYERVMLRVSRPESGCWLYQGAKDIDGYGNVRVKRPDGRWSCVKAHRVVHEHHFGPIPDGHVVRHACDTPGCVRPDHIRETGTHYLNVQDMIIRRRCANQYGPWRPRSEPEIDPDCPF
jgi:hypothetical protein